jgi:hypothetical protein
MSNTTKSKKEGSIMPKEVIIEADAKEIAKGKALESIVKRFTWGNGS